MFQKIANILSIVSFVMVASMSGGAYLGYKYVTSENFKSQVMNEILGCSFVLEDRNTGETVLAVGSSADSAGTNLSLMMLKPRNSHPNHPSWPLMFKNVYYLGTTQINQEGFEVKIINKRSTPESERDRATSLPYITLFGLDSLDVNGQRQYDELIDVQSGNILNMLNGELIIPALHPFAISDSLQGKEVTFE